MKYLIFFHKLLLSINNVLNIKKFVLSELVYIMCGLYLMNYITLTLDKLLQHDVLLAICMNSLVFFYFIQNLNILQFFFIIIEFIECSSTLHLVIKFMLCFFN